MERALVFQSSCVVGGDCEKCWEVVYVFGLLAADLDYQDYVYH